MKSLCALSNGDIVDDLEWPIHHKPPHFLHFAYKVMVGRSRLQICMWVEHSKSQPTDNKPPWNGRGHVTWSSLNFKALNHISRITEARVVKFLTQVGVPSVTKKITYHPLNGRSYGHVTVFTARRSYASAVLGVVILSVRLSHACFVTNRKNLPAIFLYHMKGQSF